MLSRSFCSDENDRKLTREQVGKNKGIPYSSEDREENKATIWMVSGVSSLRRSCLTCVESWGRAFTVRQHRAQKPRVASFTWSVARRVAVPVGPVPGERGDLVRRGKPKSDHAGPWKSRGHLTLKCVGRALSGTRHRKEKIYIAFFGDQSCGCVAGKLWWEENRSRDIIYGATGDGDLDTRGLVAVGRQVYMWCVFWSS